MWRRVDIMLTDVSEERIGSIFRVAGAPAHADSLSDFFFCPEGGSDTFLRNVG
jgi:hypothetical protein